MGGNRILLLTLMLCLGQRVVSVPTISTTLQPENLLLTPDISAVGDSFSVTCKVNNIRQTDILQTIFLLRNASGDTGNSFLNVGTYLVDTTQFYPGADMPTLTVTNSSTSVSRTLTVTIEHTRCQDAGTYRCKTTVVNTAGEAIPELVEDKVLHVEVTPGNMTMVPSPSGVTVWTVGQTLELLCSAAVGTVFPDSQIEFKWQYSDSGSGWTDYEHSEDIATGTPVVNAEGCYERWSSTLTRVLNTSDTGREYRCFVRRNNFNYLQFAAVHEVGTVNEDGGIWRGGQRLASKRGLDHSPVG